MRTDVRGDYRLATIHQEDNTSTAPAGQLNTQGRNCSNTRMDTKVSYPRRVGKEEATVRSDGSANSKRRFMCYDFRYILRDLHEQENRYQGARHVHSISDVIRSDPEISI